MASNDNVTIPEGEAKGVVAQSKDTEAAGSPSSLTEKIRRAFLEHFDALPEADQSLHLYFARHDGKVHDPLGAGSYIFEKEYVPSLMRYMGLPLGGNEFVNRTSRPATSAVVHIGAQPNNSPHAGTIVVFILAFLIARDIKKFYKELRTGDISEEFRLWIDDFQILVRLDLVDTAPDNKSGCKRDGITYQRSHRFTHAHHSVLPDYEEVIQSAADFVDGTISFEINNQESLATMSGIPCIIDAIVGDRERLGLEMAPRTQVLAMRCACPHEGCGLAEKHGRKNQYSVDASGVAIISFYCPDHGYHSVTTSNPADVARLEFNTPLRNLVRALAFGFHTADSRKPARTAIGVQGMEEGREWVHMRVTGNDYAGTYSEQLLWRQLFLLSSAPNLGGIPPPVISYAPLVLDWAGSKLSKSLYVEKGAYKYLQDMGMGYLLSFREMKESGRDHKILFEEVARWLESPKKLFRSYSTNYLHMVFEGQMNLQ